MKYGVFISHRHEDWALAGRVYDILENRGFQPFLDVNSLHQGNYCETLEKCVRETPYFLCLLTEHTFQSVDAEDWVIREIKAALESNREIILLAEQGFRFPENLPDEIRKIADFQHYEFDRSNFRERVEKICRFDLKKEVMYDVLDWRIGLGTQAVTCLAPRKKVEREFAPLEKRFGMERVRCIKEGRPYTGENHIQFVHMSCYAASIIFSHEKEMVDEQAFDRGLMFNIFASLLEDEEFSLEIVINAPGSVGMQDAIDHKKLGNSALEAYPEAIFLSSYCNIQRLIREDPVFGKAYREKRFRFMVTESVLPYALFQMEYKPGFEAYSHMKVDLYSEGLVSNMDRRCMMIFKETDPENYSFFVERYKCVRNVRESRRLIAENHERWLQEWADMQEEMSE